MIATAFLLDCGWKLICCSYLMLYNHLTMASLLSILPTISKGIIPSALSSSRILVYHQRNVFLRAAISSRISRWQITVESDNKIVPEKIKFCQRNYLPLVQSRMSSSTSNLVAEHDPKSQKFFIKLGDAEAKLEYVKKGDVLNMWHTEVPPALQGKGIAKILAKEAFDYVVKQNLKMHLSCTYLQKYYKENLKPEYTEHLA